MKNIPHSLLLVILIIFTGCSIDRKLNKQLNSYYQNNKIVLDQANYKIIGEVHERKFYNSTLNKFGPSINNIIPNAINNMYVNAAAQYPDKPIAIININFERISLFGIHKLKVNGTLIEFTK